MTKIILFMTLIIALSKIANGNEKSLYTEFYGSSYDQLFLEERTEYLCQLVTLALPSSQSILDAGTGSGNELNCLQHLGHAVTGLDISKAMLKINIKKNPNAKLVLGDIFNSNQFVAQKFEHIISFYSPIFYQQNWEKALLNFHHWLKPGGLVFIDIMDMIAYQEYSTIPHFSANWSKTLTIDSSAVLYRSNWMFPAPNKQLYFESFLFPDGNIKTKVHKLYTPTISQLIEVAASIGLKKERIHNLIEIGDIGEYLIVFRKT